ncbi:hypothetical protein VTK73DRAFT_7795 [Phialemonium thermophilum]|uniref:Uncharacterized protein n=1 Tax=Phialemonium thermophilum TaxID=223376 RepID=A0ABR3WCH3_9PEZI
MECHRRAEAAPQEEGRMAEDGEEQTRGAHSCQLRPFQTAVGARQLTLFSCSCLDPTTLFSSSTHPPPEPEIRQSIFIRLGRQHSLLSWQTGRSSFVFRFRFHDAVFVARPLFLCLLMSLTRRRALRNTIRRRLLLLDAIQQTLEEWGIINERRAASSRLLDIVPRHGEVDLGKLADTTGEEIGLDQATSPDEKYGRSAETVAQSAAPSETTLQPPASVSLQSGPTSTPPFKISSADIATFQTYQHTLQHMLYGLDKNTIAIFERQRTALVGRLSRAGLKVKAMSPYSYPHQPRMCLPLRRRLENGSRTIAD